MSKLPEIEDRKNKADLVARYDASAVLGQQFGIAPEQNVTATHIASQKRIDEITQEEVLRAMQDRNKI